MTDSTNLLALADQCVKCGLCLPQCPTYALSLNENESPRGRISLVQALAQGHLEVNNVLAEHLDHCLQCRRCERVCPSQVSYGEIISDAYQQFPGLKQHTPATGKLGLFFLRSSRRLNFLKTLLRFYQQSGLQFFARVTGLLNILELKPVEQLLPEITHGSKKQISQKPFSDRVAIFTGCSQTVFDSKAINAATKLLNALGIDVVIPDQQGCCGALHKLQGEDPSSLINNNINTFEKYNIDTVLYLSTGCGAFIKEQYDSSISFIEITDYLQQQPANKLSFKPFNKVVAVQLPCSQKNVLRQADTASSLLKNIPGIELFSLEQHGCCGAGGTTMLKYPQMADDIRQPLLDKMTTAGCELVVTTNPGCQLHIQNGFNKQNSATKVLHPVTLLARQLEEYDQNEQSELGNC